MSPSWRRFRLRRLPFAERSLRLLRPLDAGSRRDRRPRLPGPPLRFGHRLRRRFARRESSYAAAGNRRCGVAAPLAPAGRTSPPQLAACGVKSGPLAGSQRAPAFPPGSLGGAGGAGGLRPPRAWTRWGGSRSARGAPQRRAWAPGGLQAARPPPRFAAPVLRTWRNSGGAPSRTASDAR